MLTSHEGFKWRPSCSTSFMWPHSWIQQLVRTFFSSDSGPRAFERLTTGESMTMWRSTKNTPPKTSPVRRSNNTSTFRVDTTTPQASPLLRRNTMSALASVQLSPQSHAVQTSKSTILTAYVKRFIKERLLYSIRKQNYESSKPWMRFRVTVAPLNFLVKRRWEMGDEFHSLDAKRV